MTLLDATLLVGSAAIGFGLFEIVHRGLFQGWIWIMDHGLPDPNSWTALSAIVTCSDVAVFLIPVVAPWTVLLILLRLRPPRPSWKRIWRQPGMAACLAAIVGWLWSALAVLLAFDIVYVTRPFRTYHPPFEWVQTWLSDEVFMYVGLAVAAAWTVIVASGRWTRPVDWIDWLGRIVGAIWIVIGVVWAFRAYIEFI
jgi:hypothetical protein